MSQSDSRNDSGGKKPEGNDPLVSFAKYSHLGFILPAAALVGWLVGFGLDRLLHTHWINYAGLAFGVVAGFYDLIRSAIRMGNEKDE